MLLYGFYFIYCLGRASEPRPSLLVVGGSSCAWFVQLSLTDCLLVFTFYILSRLMPSGLKSMWGNSGLRFSRLGFYQNVYHKRFIPVSSYHYGLCMLILCDLTLDPRMHWCVARTKVM